MQAACLDVLRTRKRRDFAGVAKRPEIVEAVVKMSMQIRRAAGCSLELELDPSNKELDPRTDGEDTLLRGAAIPRQQSASRRYRRRCSGRLT